MHSRLAGSRGDCVERELEQRAGEGPLRCYGNDAAPAGDVGCTQSRADGSVRARGFGAAAATSLDSEDTKVQVVSTASWAPCQSGKPLQTH